MVIDLHQPILHVQATQRQVRLAAAGNNQMQRRRRMVQQPVQTIINLRVSNILVIIEDQRQRNRITVQLVDEPGEKQPEVVSGGAFRQSIRRLPERPQRRLQIAHKQEGRVVIFINAQPGQRTPLLLLPMLIPLGQQRGFAEPGGGAYQR